MRLPDRSRADGSQIPCDNEAVGIAGDEPRARCFSDEARRMDLRFMASQDGARS